MKSSQTESHSFVVKVWVEETTKHNKSTIWRGHITHVMSRQRRYFDDLSEVQLFIQGYLDQMGVKIGWHKRISVHVCRLLSHFRFRAD